MNTLIKNNFSSIWTFIFLIPNLILAQSSSFVGATSDGGSDGYGSIYSTNNDGSNYSIDYSFQGENIGDPHLGSKMTELNGVFYGVLGGGRNSSGVIFSYDPQTNIYEDIYHFSRDVEGYEPCQSLTLASNGKFYGVTSNGGPSNGGTLYEFDASNGEVIIRNAFLGGTNTLFRLTEVGSLKFYGIKSSGGSFGQGMIYAYDLNSNSYVELLYFNSSQTGSFPNSALELTSAGLLFGTTLNGGNNNVGVIYSFDPLNNFFQIKHHFFTNGNSYYPENGILEASNGFLYGTTRSNSQTGIFTGSIYSYSLANNTFSIEVSFDTVAYCDLPAGGLIENANSELIGTTLTGGANGAGNVFKFNPLTHSLSQIGSLNAMTTGSHPRGDLSKHSSGKIFAMTTKGSDYDFGQLIEIHTNSDSISSKVEFNKSEFGRYPKGKLCYAKNGLVYGVTRYGGLNNTGILFEYDPADKTFTKLIDLNVDNSVQFEFYFGLIEADSGHLYGVLPQYNHGVNNDGVIYEYNYITKGFQIIDSWGTGTQGKQPSSELVLYSDSLVFGVNFTGGVNNKGTIYSYNLKSKSYIDRYHFTGAIGNNPFGKMFKSCSGKLYGTTRSSQSGGGVIFEFDVNSNTIPFSIKESEFSALDMDGPSYENEKGELFGTIPFGGTAPVNGGYIYKLNPFNQIFSKEFSFTDGLAHGNITAGSLTANYKGVLYGFTYYGGVHDRGTFFEYNPETQVFRKILDMDNNMGLNQPLTGLAELKVCSKEFNELDTTIIQQGELLIPQEKGNLNFDWFNVQDECVALIDSSNILEITENGNYYLIISDSVCQYKSSIYNFNTVGILDLFVDDVFEVFPNPAANELNLYFPFPGKRTIELMNLSGGNLVRKICDDLSSVTIDLKGISSGLYLVRSCSQSGCSTKKIVKE